MSTIPFVSDDEAIAYAQEVRKALVEDMCRDGSMPSDNEARNTMLRAIEGIASTASAGKRLKRDVDATSNEREAQQLLREAFKLIGQHRPSEDVVVIERHINIPAVLVADVVIAEGETDIGVSTETYDTFAAKHDL